ncbi:hypothetical protein NEMIN01_1317 [Nematocida minor]|uniref:uncharacterized protein n=1 Tax=Nematocida minor TaxID=1912983 RepID=UPI00221FCA33|nr:uncharacterized protein NEMIN01_1317 [Nematocida minor]KAI5190984.1 hypothetical protein NEMIN01_1317 [Nematocida minor]
MEKTESCYLAEKELAEETGRRPSVAKETQHNHEEAPHHHQRTFSSVSEILSFQSDFSVAKSFIGSNKTYLAGSSLYMSMISSMLGAGVLYLYICFESGGVVSFFLAMLFSYTSLISVTECVYRRQKIDVHNAPEDEEKSVNSMTYTRLAKIDKRVFRWILSCALTIQSAISVIIYVSLISVWAYSNVDFFQNRIYAFSDATKYIVKAAMTLAGLIMLWMFSVQKEPGDSPHMQIISVVSIVSLSIFLAIIIAIVYSMFSFSFDYPNYNLVSGVLVGKDPGVFNFLRAVSVAFFALNTHHNIPIYLSKTELMDKRNMIKPMLMGSLLVCCIYATIGFEGFLLSYSNSFKNTDKDILTSMSIILDSHKAAKSESLHLLAEILVFVFKIAISSILMNTFMWQSYTYRNLITDVYRSTKKEASKSKTFYRAKRKLSEMMPCKVKEFFRIQVSETYTSIKKWIKSKMGRDENVVMITPPEKKDEEKEKESGVLRYIIGTFVFLSTILVVLMEVNVEKIINLSGALIASYITLFIPSCMVYENMHISKSHGKRWFDYCSISIMMCGFLSLSINGIVSAFYSITSANEMAAAMNATGST